VSIKFICCECQRISDFPKVRGRCSSCARAYERERSAARRAHKGTTSQRGYGSGWQTLVTLAIQAQPWCTYCHTRGSKGNPLTGDHRIPLSKGGTARSVADVIVACRSCNSARGNREVVGGGGRVEDVGPQ
jgi:5-methylcytosine-specific restriction endonuclease McrA